AKDLIDRALENVGEATLISAGLTARGVAVFLNRPGASFIVQGNGVWAAGARFDNAGTLRGLEAGEFTMGGVFENQGAVDLSPGAALNLDGRGTSSGSMLLGGGAQLRFRGGSYTLAQGSSLTGAGLVAVPTDGAVLTVAGLYEISGATSVSNG